jgi:hypothetical protein
VYVGALEYSSLYSEFADESASQNDVARAISSAQNSYSYTGPDNYRLSRQEAELERIGLEKSITERYGKKLMRLITEQERRKRQMRTLWSGGMPEELVGTSKPGDSQCFTTCAVAPFRNSNIAIGAKGFSINPVPVVLSAGPRINEATHIWDRLFWKTVYNAGKINNEVKGISPLAERIEAKRMLQRRRLLMREIALRDQIERDPWFSGSK